MISFGINIRAEELTALEYAVARWARVYPETRIAAVDPLPDGIKGVTVECPNVTIAFYIGTFFGRRGS